MSSTQHAGEGGIERQPRSGTTGAERRRDGGGLSKALTFPDHYFAKDDNNCRCLQREFVAKDTVDTMARYLGTRAQPALTTGPDAALLQPLPSGRT